MEWYRQVQFIAAVPMPQDIADAYGTTVNGMWADPERCSVQDFARARARGGRVLFSVPLIALTPKVYETEEHQFLLEEVCRDINGTRALVPWYYWEDKPVYSVCIHSAAFRRYLLDRCREGIDRGMDVVNLDEINTSIGLMDRKEGGSGFCRYCLARFRRHLDDEAGGAETPTRQADVRLLAADDDTLRRALKNDDDTYQRYRRFHEREAFRVVLGFIENLRSHAGRRNPEFAITANLAYLGNAVITHGDLWGPRWGEHIDFVMMENMYRVEPDGPHELLPRGKFTAWYRLGSAFSSRAPNWICPSILVPKQLAGEVRTRYYLLMFLEAYANGGRWGYYWWPGVDEQTRMRATAPEQLKEYIQFITRYREYYEQATPQNELAILYLDGSISRKPETHLKYLALAQALAEAGYQFDVIYVGDDSDRSGALTPERLERYDALLVPEAGALNEAQAWALTEYVRHTEGELIVFSRSSIDAGLVQQEDGEVLFDFWRNYRDEDRQRIVARVERFWSARVRSSDPMVNVIGYARGEEKRILHLVNYDYEAATDRVAPSRRLRVHIPWEAGREVTCTLLRPEREEKLRSTLENEELTLEIPELDLYGLVVVG